MISNLLMENSTTVSFFTSFHSLLVEKIQNHTFYYIDNQVLKLCVYLNIIKLGNRVIYSTIVMNNCSLHLLLFLGNRTSICYAVFKSGPRTADSVRKEANWPYFKKSFLEILSPSQLGSPFCGTLSPFLLPMWESVLVL